MRGRAVFINPHEGPSRGLQDQPREQDHHDDDDRDRHADEGGVLPGLVWHEKAPLTGAGIRRYDWVSRDVSGLSGKGGNWAL